MIDQIKKTLEKYNGKWKEKSDIFEFQAVIAQRKVFLSKKTLTYSAKLKINDDDKIIVFSECLKESGMGLASAGIGFSSESYNTTDGSRKGSIKEQSKLFGKNYSYDFDYSEIRTSIEKIAKANNYKFEYKIF